MFEHVFKQEPTIVTSFYNIRKMENNPLCESRGEDTYLDLANHFILQLPYNLIIFIQSIIWILIMILF